jgi:hypothetical protein
VDGTAVHAWRWDCARRYDVGFAVLPERLSRIPMALLTCAVEMLAALSPGRALLFLGYGLRSRAEETLNTGDEAGGRRLLPRQEEK